MEKQQNRGQLCKNTVVEAKNKNNDASGQKLFPKGARKRETLFPKAEAAQRKQACNQAVQKNKCQQKPIPRGFNHSAGGTNPELMTDFQDEDYFDKRSKKRNMGHLLKYQCGVRRDEAYEYWPTMQRTHTTIRDLMVTQKHDHNKEQFLQANCQFVVRKEGDYIFHWTDPDVLVDWTLIEQIIMPSWEIINCPICLYPPVAGKITRCGHVFCWPCILHYLSLSSHNWHKCPICFESVYAKDLKSVAVMERKSFSVGDSIMLQLMKREKGTAVVVPVSESPSRPTDCLLSVDDGNYTTVFSKLLTADCKLVLDLVEGEIQALRMQMEEDGSFFTQLALDLALERKANMIPKVEELSDECGKEGSFNAEKSPSEGGIQSDDKGFESGSGIDGNILDAVTNDLTNYYYFYQAADGQYIFLHSINNVILRHTYGDYDGWPAFMQGKILEVESGSMTRELRRRLRYLEHLPVTSQFHVVELDLQPPVVSEQALEACKERLEKRRRCRQERAREENRAGRRLERRQAAQQFAMIKEAVVGNKVRSAQCKPRLDSMRDFPQCGADCEDGSEMSSRSGSPGVAPMTADFKAMSTNTFAEKLKSTPKGNVGVKSGNLLESNYQEAGPSHLGVISMSDALEAALLKARERKNGSNRGRKKKGKANNKNFARYEGLNDRDSC